MRRPRSGHGSRPRRRRARAKHPGSGARPRDTHQAARGRPTQPVQGPAHVGVAGPKCRHRSTAAAAPPPPAEPPTFALPRSSRRHRLPTPRCPPPSRRRGHRPCSPSRNASHRPATKAPRSLRICKPAGAAYSRASIRNPLRKCGSRVRLSTGPSRGTTARPPPSPRSARAAPRDPRARRHRRGAVRHLPGKRHTGGPAPTSWPPGCAQSAGPRASHATTTKATTTRRPAPGRGRGGGRRGRTVPGPRRRSEEPPSCHPSRTSWRPRPHPRAPPCIDRSPSRGATPGPGGRSAPAARPGPGAARGRRRAARAAPSWPTKREAPGGAGAT
mmetsp:Transcript_67399/g.219568  ORF Transcript_67399/g.219568 Transcript_67399/m.219568 type:complete len:329 (+) Transcript_67399:1361-2347(+)